MQEFYLLILTCIKLYFRDYLFKTDLYDIRIFKLNDKKFMEDGSDKNIIKVFIKLNEHLSMLQMTNTPETFTDI